MGAPGSTAGIRASTTEAVVPLLVRRVRTGAVCAALVALALKQQSGALVGDTKLDLSVDPYRFLGRVLHLWDPSGNFGQTQNQGYGYLFPMGPFFALGRMVALPPWVVQRLWWAALLVLAFTGMSTLAARLRIGEPTAQIIGGLAFALSPRLLSTMGANSVESLPYCLAPWVLVPLVSGSRGGSTRRAAALSALVVLAMGAVNAAAVLAALPPAALFLLTRTRGSRKRSLMRWWALSVVLACGWWLGPLLLLSKYSPPFLDYIESASITTSVTSLVEVLRGTSDWVGYVATGGRPTWPTAFALLSTPSVIVYTCLVVAAGVGGLLRRDIPERAWLTWCLLLGVAAVTAGHTGPLTGALAGPERSLLDGALAPFRNVHKFEVVLRIPLVLGFTHLVGAMSRTSSRVRQPARHRSLVRVAALSAVLGAALPAVSTGLSPGGSFAGIPGYWRQAATWLGDHGDQGRALLLPGARFPDYLWGSTNDEPLQVLDRAPFAVRNAVPLTPPGTIRYLNGLEQQLASGTPSAGLASYLSRAGIRYVVLRNDLAYGALGATRPLLVHEAVATSPGIVQVASFGPLVGGGNVTGYVDENLEVPYHAVEVYAVQAGTAVADAYPLGDVVRVIGGPEALLPLQAQGVLSGRPTVLDHDGGSVAALGSVPVVLTDTTRRREVFFGADPDKGTSATLTASDPFRREAPAHDYLLQGAGHQLATARLVGARSITTSSSASDAAAFGGAERTHAPAAAVDGDVSTSWRSDIGQPLRRAFWRLDLDAPVDLSGLTVRFDSGGGAARVTKARISAASGSVVVTVPSDGSAVAVSGLTGSSTWLSLSTEAVSGAGLGTLGVAEVTWPGVMVRATLDTARAPGTPVVSLVAADDERPSCYQLFSDSLCSTTVGRPGEDSSGLDRTLHLQGVGTYRLQSTAEPRPGPALDELLDQGTGVTVTASSSAVGDPAGRPGTIVDGRLGTGWRAMIGDHDPTLTVTYLRMQRVTGIRLRTATSLAASNARAVEVVSGVEHRTGILDGKGAVTFTGLTGRRFTIRLLDVVPATSFDPYSSSRGLLPVGVSELTLDGADRPLTPPTTVHVSCAFGPVVRIGDALRRASFLASRSDLEQLRPFSLSFCGASRVIVGDGTRIIAPASALTSPVSVTLRPEEDLRLDAAPLPEIATVPTRWGVAARQLRIAERSTPTLLVVHENTNAGWSARLDGRVLTRVVIDGWQQGWVVPPGAAATVDLRYDPDGTYRSWLLVGAFLVLALLGLVAAPVRALPAAAVGGRSLGWASTAAGLVVLVLIGGGAGLVLALLAGGAVLATRTSWAHTWPLLGAIPVLVAGGLLAWHPWPGSPYAGRGSVAQALCLAALGMVWATGLPAGRLRRSLRRKQGRSTSR
jgi:arabinofuranan 3-O-arabinosyltransferase